MAEPELRASRGDYLTRLAGLAGRGAAPDADPAERPVILLRPRLPARFEAALESLSGPGDWSDGLAEAGGTLPRPTGTVEGAPLPPEGPGLPRPAPLRAAASRVAELAAPRAPREAVVARPAPSGEADPVSLDRPAAPLGTPSSADPAPLPQRPATAPERAAPASLPVPGEERGLPVSQSARAPKVFAEGVARQSGIAADAVRTEAEPEHTVRPHPVLRLRPAGARRESEEVEPEKVRQATGAGRDADAADGAGRRRAAAVPAIQVTIGRIEVRAPAVPPPPALPRPEPPRPAVSLDEYLQRRSDGRY